MAQDQWHWQERGTAWKGIGIYHVTLTVTNRQPLLGNLVIPEQDPAKAYVDETPLAKDLITCLLHLHERYPEVMIMRFCVMPDHLHFIIRIRRQMKQGIMTVLRSFWQAAKKYGRLYSASNACLSDTDLPATPRLSITPDSIRQSSSATPRLSIMPDSIRQSSGPLFHEMPFVRPLSRHGQLDAMMHYVQMNPQRLATKRLKLGFFCVQSDIAIAGRTYSGVGNIKLLQSKHFAPVHVRHEFVDQAKAGNPQPLREYMDSCIAAARQGAVLVSPFISKYEKEVLSILLAEHLPFILLTDNGFRDYYKPTDAIFDAVDAGNVLILSPFQHDPSKRGISRDECVALNGMAEEICRSFLPDNASSLNSPV